MNHSNISMSLVLLGVCIAFSFPCNAQSSLNPNTDTSVTQTNVNDSQAATGNGEWGSSYLKAHDRVIVQAPETSSAPGTYGVCKAVLSNDSKDIFVPWNNSMEWSNFLQAVTSGSLGNYSISSCCKPLTASVCGTDTGIQMGYRRLGTVLDSRAITGKPLDPALKAAYDLDNTYLQHFGGQGDIYGPVYSSSIAGDANTDYQVTYVCSAGTWIKTHEVGSCVPLNGACNSPGIMKTLPSDTTTLCGAGSIISNLTTVTQAGVTTGWTWECNGTPGMSNAQCAAYVNPPQDAVCGPLANDSAGQPMYSYAQMTSMNPSLLCNPGTLNVGSINNENGVLTFWVFECMGVNGGANAQCYALDDGINGMCGNANGATVTAAWTPVFGGVGNGGLNPCSQWGENATNPQFTGNTWTWTCEGNGNGGMSPTCSATIDTGSTNGLCGSDAYQVFAPGSLLSTDPNLCSTGSVTNFLYNATAYTWTWTCTGSGTNGVSASCSAGTVPAQNGACGIDAGETFTAAYPLSATDPNLCSVGSPITFALNTATHPPQYNWGCTPIGSAAVLDTASCTAYGPDVVNGTCGTANGFPSIVAPSITPSTNICATGTWTSISADSTNTNWIWTCNGSGGGTNMSCSAPISDVFANGVCGTTNGTYIPNTPNFNMCNSGIAGPVSGSGPWTWTCRGTGGGADSPQCSASLCQACSGTITSAQTGNTQKSTGACRAQGTTSWTEVDALISGAASSGTLSWTDAMGAFSQSVNYSSPPTYCSPCYQQIQSVSNVQIMVQHASSGCPFHTGDVLTPDAPPIVTVP